MKQGYIYLPHTADIKFQAFGQTLEQCFEYAGYALVKIICKKKIKPVEKKQIKIKARDLKALLYDFLEEFLYVLDVGDFLVSEIKNIKITGTGQGKKRNYELSAELFGDDINNYKLDGDVKAITYNEMFIKIPSKDGGNNFACQVVVDV